MSSLARGMAGQATLAFDLTRPFVVMLPPYSLTNDQCQAVSQLV
jgi:hypothetical protein